MQSVAGCESIFLWIVLWPVSEAEKDFSPSSATFLPYFSFTLQPATIRSQTCQANRHLGQRRGTQGRSAPCVFVNCPSFTEPQKGRSRDTCCGLEEPWGHCPGRTDPVQLLLYGLSRGVRFVQTARGAAGVKDVGWGAPSVMGPGIRQTRKEMNPPSSQ